MGEFSKTSYSLARASGRPVLYIVRHGDTGDDDSYNSPENPHLTDKGRADAEAAAEFLAGKETGPMSASRHRRTVETAEIIGKRLGKKAKVDSRLDSLDVGDVANASSSEEADRIIKHHVENPHKVIPGGESLDNFRSHVDPALREGVREGIRTGKPPIQSAHHSVQHEAGRLFNNDIDSALTKTGGVIAVILTPNGLKAIPVFRPEKD